MNQAEARRQLSPARLAEYVITCGFTGCTWVDRIIGPAATAAAIRDHTRAHPGHRPVANLKPEFVT